MSSEINNAIRTEPRRWAHFQVIYDDSRSWTSAWVENASEHGLYLAAPNPVPIGAILRLEPAGKDKDALFEVNARVVRCERLDPNSADERALDGAYGIAVELLLPPHRTVPQ